MKKILLGTTAFLAASVAFAQEAPKLGISGSFNAHLNTSSFSQGTSGRNSPDDAGWRVNQTGGGNEIVFSGSGKTDAGLAYGAKVEHGFVAGATDEAGVWFSGSWGRLEIGQDDSPAGNNHLGGQSAQAGTGGVNGDHNLSPTGTNRALGVNFNISGDDAKVSYMLPTIAGFTAGVSLAPSGGTAGNAAASGTTAFAAPATSYRNALEASARYVADLGGAAITIGGTYAQAKNNTEFASNTVNATASTNVQQISENLIHNHRGYNVGVKVDVGAMSVGAGHTNRGKGGITKAANTTANTIRDNGSVSTIGVKYSLGGGTDVGLGYAASKQGIVAGTTHKGSRSSTLWSAGVTTAVAPGLSVFGEFNTISGTTGAVTSGGYRGNEVIVGTSISF